MSPSCVGGISVAGARSCFVMLMGEASARGSFDCHYDFKMVEGMFIEHRGIAEAVGWSESFD